MYNVLAQNKTTIQTYTSGMGLNDTQKNAVVKEGFGVLCPAYIFNYILKMKCTNILSFLG